MQRRIRDVVAERRRARLIEHAVADEPAAAPAATDPATLTRTS